jgi:uncharacterized protein (TIGR03435 family)
MRQTTTGTGLILRATAVAALPVLTLLGSMAAPRLAAQAPPTQSLTNDWQTAAGGKMAFDVASVKPNKSDDPPTSTFPLGPGDAYVPSGGLFTASNQPLIAYLTFAYKLRQGDLAGLRAWVYNDRFDVEARAHGAPTKDQMRLMMQSLLADRFKLAVHTETKQGPVFALVLSKPGKTGPQLQRDAGRFPTASTPQTPAAVPPPPSPPSSTSGLQLPAIPCGSIGPVPASTSERGRLGGRDVTVGRIAGFLKNPYTGVDRPVLDRTGLVGTFDFSLEWLPEPDPSQPPGSQPDEEGPTLLEALKQQLGSELKSQTGPVEVLVIDHVEQPSPN